MALKAAQDKVEYVKILGSDGTFRKTVTEDTPGAIRRDWENGKGDKGTVFEHIYSELSGIISSIEMYEGDFGKNLIIGVTDGDEPEIKMSVGMDTNYGEDLAKKLPAIDKTKEVIFKPYCFTDDKKKVLKGVSVMQDGKKVLSFFYDKDSKTNLHEYPLPLFKIDKKTGKEKPFSKDEWKIYFSLCKQFLIDYIEENLITEEVKEKVVTKKEEQPTKEVSKAVDQSEDIPF